MPIVVWSRRFASGHENARRPGDSAARSRRRPKEVAERSDVLSVHLALDAGHARPGRRGGPRAAETRRVLHQHGARRSRGLRGARDGGPRAARPRRPRRLRRTSQPARRVNSSDALGSLPGRLRHAPHRRIDRSGAGGHRRRNRPHHRELQGHRQGAERRQPREEDAGDAHARRPPPRSARRPGARLRAPAQQRHQRAGDRERDLRGRAGRGRAHQPRRRAVGRVDASRFRKETATSSSCSS